MKRLLWKRGGAWDSASTRPPLLHFLHPVAWVPQPRKYSASIEYLAYFCVHKNHPIFGILAISLSKITRNCVLPEHHFVPFFSTFEQNLSDILDSFNALFECHFVEKYQRVESIKSIKSWRFPCSNEIAKIGTKLTYETKSKTAKLLELD